MTTIATETTVNTTTDELYFIDSEWSYFLSDERLINTYWNETKGKIEKITVYTYSVYGEGGYTPPSKPITEEIKIKAIAYEQQQFNLTVDSEYQKIQQKIADLNAAMPYQKKGQTVEVISGRKNKGFKGIVFWEGYDQYKSTSNNRTFMQDTILKIIDDGILKKHISQFDRIGIKDSEGKTVFVSTSYCKVVEGFEPATVTRAEAETIVKNRQSNFKSLFS